MIVKVMLYLENIMKDNFYGLALLHFFVHIYTATQKFGICKISNVF